LVEIEGKRKGITMCSTSGKESGEDSVTWAPRWRRALDAGARTRRKNGKGLTRRVRLSEREGEGKRRARAGKLAGPKAGTGLEEEFLFYFSLIFLFLFFFSF
jgi:hypothetical protein